jgi:hypothetical protein
LHKSSNHSICNKSPDFILSDYISFKNKNDKVACSESIESPNDSFGCRSPDFQLSDYILLNNRSAVEESTIEVVKENKSEKIDYNKLDIASLPLIINLNSDNLYQPCSLVIDKKIIIDKDKTQKEQNQNDRVNYDHLKCYKFPSYSILEKKLRNNENLTEIMENSLNKKKDTDQQNNLSVECVNNISDNFQNPDCSTTEKSLKAYECDKIEINENKNIADDEDKENKEKNNEKKEKEANSKEESNGKFVSLSIENHETSKTKEEIQEDENEEAYKKKKPIRQSKRKKLKEQSKKSDMQVSIQKGRRKKKPRALLYEGDNEVCAR